MAMLLSPVYCPGTGKKNILAEKNYFTLPNMQYSKKGAVGQVTWQKALLHHPCPYNSWMDGHSIQNPTG